jgi:hypothetical protein
VEDDLSCAECREILIHNERAASGEGHQHPTGYWLACPVCDRTLLVTCPPQLLRLVLGGAGLLSESAVSLTEGWLADLLGDDPGHGEPPAA